jgi:hypothetical protein
MAVRAEISDGWFAIARRLLTLLAELSEPDRSVSTIAAVTSLTLAGLEFGARNRERSRGEPRVDILAISVRSSAHSQDRP